MCGKIQFTVFQDESFAFRRNCENWTKIGWVTSKSRTFIGLYFEETFYRRSRTKRTFTGLQTKRSKVTRIYIKYSWIHSCIRNSPFSFPHKHGSIHKWCHKNGWLLEDNLYGSICLESFKVLTSWPCPILDGIYECLPTVIMTRDNFFFNFTQIAAFYNFLCNI